MADRALVNARIHTMVGPTALTDALLWVDGRIQATGDAAVRQEAATRGLKVEDLEGRIVLPGFVDAHTHFLHVGVKKVRPDLQKCRSLDDLEARVRTWLADHPGTSPVIAEGWDEADWKGAPPTKDLADALSADAPDGDGGTSHRPLVLRRICGHKAVANTTALPIIQGRWSEPELVDPETGILLEQPSLYLNEVMPVDAEGLAAAIEQACAAAHAIGVTTVGDYSQAPYRTALQRASAAGALSVRVASSMYVQQLEDEIATGFTTGRAWPSPDGDGVWLRDAGLKVFHDGSFGGHTAYLREPYKDDPTTRGTPIWSDEDVARIYTQAAVAGIQIHAHAIGDAAIDQALDGFEELPPGHAPQPTADRTPPGRKDPFEAASFEQAARANPLRHRIEHYELPQDDALRRTAKLGIIASCQPNFLGAWSSKGGMYEDRLGPVFLLNNRYRRFLDEDLVVAFGSDGMPFGPLMGLWGALNHPDASQRLDIHEIIWCYTAAAAWSLHWEDDIGTLEPGKWADLLILDERELDGDPRHWTIQETIVGGETKATAATTRASA